MSARLKFLLTDFQEPPDPPPLPPVRRFTRIATLKWVIANGFDPAGLARWDLTALDGRQSGRPPPRTDDHLRYLRQLGIRP